MSWHSPRTVSGLRMVQMDVIATCNNTPVYNRLRARSAGPSCDCLCISYSHIAKERNDD